MCARRWLITSGTPGVCVCCECHNSTKTDPRCVCARLCTCMWLRVVFAVVINGPLRPVGQKSNLYSSECEIIHLLNNKLGAVHDGWVVFLLYFSRNILEICLSHNLICVRFELEYVAMIFQASSLDSDRNLLSDPCHRV